MLTIIIIHRPLLPTVTQTAAATQQPAAANTEDSQAHN